ncbi:MAG: cell filamentation protein Fic [Elusimicrobia bacterium CG_4_10_14_0_8_um_filter_37_32]|nr:MAG: cell filamentation protein Fic [Elusimicrobia bacterium CG_4_10_14_0_8_um_filter_37_32]
MKSFEENYFKQLKFPSEIISTLRAIGEYKGKQELYIRQSPDILEKLLESAIVESTESSNRIEGIIAQHNRIEAIVKANAKPKVRPEQEIAGYRDVLNLIHQSHEDIPVLENVILQFHSMLYRYTDIPSGSWKKWDNEIVDKYPDGTRVLKFKPVAAFETPEYMNKLISLYKDYSENEYNDPLVLIPLFVFDFLCIHPFKDGNGRISRLLTLLLLYQKGYKVGKYISIERIIEQSKSSYYDALESSSKEWHQSQHDIFPWFNYFYGVLIAAYKEFESRVGSFKGKGSKTEQVKSAIDIFIKPFSISDLEKNCPNVTRDMIRKILRQLRDENKIKSSGIGRNAKWEKNRVIDV